MDGRDIEADDGPNTNSEIGLSRLLTGKIMASTVSRKNRYMKMCNRCNGNHRNSLRAKYCNISCVFPRRPYKMTYYIGKLTTKRLDNIRE